MISEKILSSLVHSPTTDLAKRRISNHDAALLVIARDGSASCAEVTRALKKWRGDDGLLFTYLWNKSSYGGYGFVGQNVGSVFNIVDRAPFGGKNRRRTYWFRLRTGVYSLTFEGLRRLAELNDQLENFSQISSN